MAEPAIMFTRPFAENGDKNIITDSAPLTGRASLSEGFPPETETPLAVGGLPPYRVDHNGILYQLSSVAFWAERGGMRSWYQTVKYEIPAIVWHNSDFWQCLAENGVGTSAGVQEPADGSLYWRRVWSELALDGGLVHFTSAATANNAIGSDGDLLVGYNSTLDGSGATTPRALYEKVSGSWVMRIDLSPTAVSCVGMVAFFAMDTPPDGWLVCSGQNVSRTTYAKLFAAIGVKWGSGNGSTTFTLPNLQNEFIRGASSTRPVGTKEGDAIRNITGSLNSLADNENLTSADTVVMEGALYLSELRTRAVGYGAGNDTGYNVLGFDASLAGVPTADENRPRNIALLACIRYI